MAIGKPGGVNASGYVKPIGRRLATDPLRRDVFVLQGVVQQVDVDRHRFWLSQEGRQYSVGWSAATTFTGIEPQTLRGVEVSVKGNRQLDDFHAESVVPVR